MDLSIAMVQQLQEYEIEMFGTNVGTTPILVALGLPMIGFGCPNPLPPTFTSQVISTSLTSTPFSMGLKWMILLLWQSLLRFSKTLMLFWMLVDATCTPKNANGRSKTLMLFWMLVDGTSTFEDAIVDPRPEILNQWSCWKR